jgi:SAM-dependent methyltransferase
MTANAPTTLAWYTGHGMARTKKRLRKRPKDDFFPTPDELCQVAIQDLTTYSDRILDPGCGTGPWGRAARKAYPEARIVGAELTADRIDYARKAGLLDAYTMTRWGNFLTMPFRGMTFNLIVGNPPYKLAEQFVMRSFELLEPGGQILFLLRTAFAEGQGRYQRMFSGVTRPVAIHSLVERPSFTGDGRTDATAYSMFLWAKNYIGPTTFGWLSWKNRDKPRQRVLF